MSLLRRFGLMACAMLLACPSTANANPANKAAFKKHFGDLMHARVATCALCHVSSDGHDTESLEEFPHNVFGNAILVAGEQLIDDAKDDAMADRMRLVSDGDADGDGVSNLVEILLGSMPGLADDAPTDAALGGQARAVAKYRAEQQQYAWRPFRPVLRPQVPSLPSGWGNNPIDAFIAEKQDQLGLSRQAEANPEHLLRRVYLDLIGLSPSVDEIQRFKMEYARDPLAYDRVVARLLQHPGYGERWGRHWMDVWRYSDWAGYKDALRESQRHIWHWRDWIVQSLGEDKGYDQMLIQMLAADELQLDDSDLRATGYLARNYFSNRDQWMDNVVKHTSQAFMGVTLGCAKCHDHMSDPFEQTEYYAMRAVFECYNVRTDRVPGELDINKNGIPRVYDKSVSAKTYLFSRGDERFPFKDAPISPAAPEALGGKLNITAVSLSHQATQPDQRPFVVAALLAAANQKISAANLPAEKAAAKKAFDAFKAELDLESAVAAGMPKNSAKWKQAATQIFVLQRESEQLAAEQALAKATRKHEATTENVAKTEASKNASAIKKAKAAEVAAEKAVKTATERVKKAAESIAAETTTKFTPRVQSTYPQNSSGRRLAFARWLTDPSNPTTARVAMNHIWLRHFGRAIVPTVNDFGAAGQPPRHPALLDWLSAELVSNDWSMKRMHQLIVTSATYRMVCDHNQANDAIDPDNRYYWTGTQRRMEGEIVRDNLLHIAGRLDSTIGGPDIDQHLAQESRRRSVYLRHAHEKLVEFVQIFDGPSVSECYMRETSIQPHQALALANSKLSVNAAEAIVTQLDAATADDDDAFVQKIFMRILGRSPKKSETQACLEFLNESDRARQNLVLVLLNHNDFVAIR